MVLAMLFGSFSTTHAREHRETSMSILLGRPTRVDRSLERPRRAVCHWTGYEELLWESRRLIQSLHIFRGEAIARKKKVVNVSYDGVQWRLRIRSDEKFSLSIGEPSSVDFQPFLQHLTSIEIQRGSLQRKVVGKSDVMPLVYFNLQRSIALASK